MPKVSVIIPVYNSEKYLKENLKLLLNQSLQDIEIICVNDGSKDNSINVLKELASEDGRIVVIDKENTGAGDSRNKGINAAKGEYLKFLDADDTMPDNALELFYNAAKENDLDIVFSQKENVSHNGSLVTRFPNPNEIFNFENSPELAFAFNASIHNKFYKTSFIKNNNLYFNNTKTCNDIFFAFYSTFLAEKCFMIDKVLYTYYSNTEKNISSTRNNYIFNLVNEMAQIKEKLEENKTFGKYKKQYFKTFRYSINYELGYCNFLNIFNFISDVLKIKSTLKYNILMLILEYFVNSIFKQIFQLTNLNKDYKRLTILGMKFKLNRRKNAKN